jgi:hypothetical protein
VKEIRELAEMLIEERVSVAPEAVLARFALAVLDALDAENARLAKRQSDSDVDEDVRYRLDTMGEELDRIHADIARRLK